LIKWLPGVSSWVSRGQSVRLITAI
jgi:hypothetical protein